ncbi:MAG: hypothetical protein ACXWYO_06685 [Gaiellaceae bacterium]
MAIPARVASFDELSETERDAVVSAAVWYAKHHESMIAGLADDPSAMAVAQRERYQELYDGLAKLGVRLHRPTGINPV